MLVISEPTRTFVRIRRPVHPYEVVDVDTYEKNAYAPQPHAGVEIVVEPSVDNPGLSPPTTTYTHPATRHVVNVQNPVDESVASFYTDYVFNSAIPRKERGYASQQVVWDRLGAYIVDDVLQGYNASLLCFGPSGSGKTYTMFGSTPPDGSMLCKSSKEPLNRDAGLLPRFCRGLFAGIAQRKEESKNDYSENNDGREEGEEGEETRRGGAVEYLVEFSAYEIRSEAVYDLLNPADHDVQIPCEIGQHPKMGVYVRNLLSIACDTAEKLMEVMEAARATRATTSLFRGTMDEGGQDHAVFTCAVTRRESVSEKEDPTNMNGFVSRATFVDSASTCDRSLAMLDARSDRMYEQYQGHRSWETMSRCVDMHSERTLAHSSSSSSSSSSYSSSLDPPHHSSSLTSLLHRCALPLGGNAKSYVLACVGPTNVDYGSTMRTLRLLARMSKVRNRPSIQQDAFGRMSRGLRAHLSMLERELSQLQADVPIWADPSTPLETLNDFGVKMTELERKTYVSSRTFAWKEYRSRCTSLACDALVTEELLSKMKEKWSDKKQRSRNEYLALCKWLRNKSCLSGMTTSAFQDQDAATTSSNNTKTKTNTEVPRLLSLHPNRDYVGAQSILLTSDGARITLGAPLCAGIGVNNSSCQITRDDSPDGGVGSSSKMLSGSSKSNADDANIFAGMKLHVSPRSDVYLNGVQVLPNETRVLHDNDVLLLGLHRMYRVAASRKQRAAATAVAAAAATSSSSEAELHCLS